MKKIVTIFCIFGLLAIIFFCACRKNNSPHQGPDSLVPPPVAVGATNINTYSFQANWKPIDEIDSFGIIIDIDTNFTSQNRVVVYTKDTFFVIGNLQPATTYYYKVVAMKGIRGIASPYSNIITITTIGKFWIPDDRFRMALKRIMPSDVFDEKDSLISNHPTVMSRYALDVNYANFIGDRDAEQIKSLAGIEYFTGLITLNCRANLLTSLDISKNTALVSLMCWNNQLIKLDVSKNTALTILECGTNQLTKLDVSKNTALTSLKCEDNQLTNLDVSKNTAIEILTCGGNQLNSLDLSKNTKLNTLNCRDNQLISLDLSKNPFINYLVCNNNSLTSLDISAQKLEGQYGGAPTIVTVYQGPSMPVDTSNTGLRTLKVNVQWQQYDEIKDIKTIIPACTISTYTNSSADAPACSDYDPNTNNCR